MVSAARTSKEISMRAFREAQAIAVRLNVSKVLLLNSPHTKILRVLTGLSHC